MQMKIIRKEYLGKDYAFIQADLEQTPDISYYCCPVNLFHI